MGGQHWQQKNKGGKHKIVSITWTNHIQQGRQLATKYTTNPTKNPWKSSISKVRGGGGEIWCFEETIWSMKFARGA